VNHGLDARGDIGAGCWGTVTHRLVHLPEGSVGYSTEERRAEQRTTIRQACPEISHSLYSNIGFTHVPYHVLCRNERIIEELNHRNASVGSAQCSE